jgi:ATP dependent DNA ligase domain
VRQSVFGREWPSFAAFDLLDADGDNLRNRPLLERERQLRALVARSNSRLLYVDHVRRHGIDLFREVCARDSEGIVAKWARGRYETDGCSTSWLKIESPRFRYNPPSISSQLQRRSRSGCSCRSTAIASSCDGGRIYDADDHCVRSPARVFGDTGLGADAIASGWCAFQ